MELQRIGISATRGHRVSMLGASCVLAADSCHRGLERGSKNYEKDYGAVANVNLAYPTNSLNSSLDRDLNINWFSTIIRSFIRPEAFGKDNRSGRYR